MKTKIKVEKEIEIKTLHVYAEARYWEDATVNDVEDMDGVLIPCREGDSWNPIIDVDSGIILNWEKGVKANIHYKVCDAGEYHLRDEKGETVIVQEGYVPSVMCPEENGYGDYIIMNVDENGLIANWEFDIEDFIEED